MGPQQVLRAAAAGVIAFSAIAAAAPSFARREKVAVIDLGSAAEPSSLHPGLGPDDPNARRVIGAAIAAQKLDPLVGDGVDDALAGQNVDRDAIQLAAALADAQRAFGALHCGDAVRHAMDAISIGAARQAAGLPVPELPTAWAYVLRCADASGDAGAATTAATRIRAAGGSDLVDAALLARYPEVDVLSNRDLVEVEVEADVPGAALWVDFQPVGKAPMHVVLAEGEHIIAAASGAKRGWIAGTAIKKQTSVKVPMTDQAGPWSALAARIASWHGKVPAPGEIAWVLGQVHARVALIRHGDVVEAWGQVGRAEEPHVLGGVDGSRPLAEVDKLVALVADRVETWNDHAPDPDKPLLVEDIHQRAHRLLTQKEEPTQWWVYATIGGALLAGAVVIYAHDSSNDVQRVELHYP